MIRLSIIVPVYGVEKYIEECIRSLYDQDIPKEEYEVICVDDCSPDNSVAVIEDWKLKVENLKLIRHTENKRQGGARNTGLKEAKGKYVWFIDSDDYIQPNCLKGLLELAEKEDLDILDFDFATESEKQTFIKNVESFEMGPCAPADYIFNEEHGGKAGWRCTSVCAGLFKRELIERNHLQFREKVQWEDDDYAIELYAYAKNVHHISAKPYIYRYTPESTVVRKISKVQVEYMTQLAVRLATLYKQIDTDIRWQGLLHEAVEYYAAEVLKALKESSLKERREFYKQYKSELAVMSGFVGKRKRLAMAYWWILDLVN